MTSRTTTNAEGVYTFPYVPIGVYEILITAPGLRSLVVTGVVVDQANISRVDRMLELGSVSESVTVEAAAPLLQQESTTFDAEVTRKFVEDLPSAVGGGTRDATSIVNILPGVQSPGAVSGQSFGSQFGVNIGGGRQFSTEFQMDGMNVAYQGVTAGVPLDMRPDYDITSEVKVQIGVPSAEYGRSSGGVVTYLSRSGTNELHGSLFWVRNTILMPGPNCHRWNRPAVGATALRRRASSYPQDLQWQEQNLFLLQLHGLPAETRRQSVNGDTPTAQERPGISDIATPSMIQPRVYLSGKHDPGRPIGSVAQAINKFHPTPTSSSSRPTLPAPLLSTTADDIFAK